jgi:ligand-binding sensor domain-containing protein
MLGTNGGGVSRFMDNQWKTYFPMHGLADYWVYSFAEAGRTLWIGTWAGLSRFDRDSGEFKTFIKELVNEWVYGLAVDKRGRLWIGTEGGMNMYDGDRWSVWTHADGLGAANDQQLPASGNTGLGTRDRHDLSVLAQGKATYNPNYVFCVLADAQQRVWAGTWGGGLAVYTGSWRNFTQNDGLGGNIVYSLAEDEQGRIWAGTNGGISVYDGQNWFTLNKSRGLGDDHVYAVASFANTIWLGIRGAVLRLGELGTRTRKIP